MVDQRRHIGRHHPHTPLITANDNRTQTGRCHLLTNDTTHLIETAKRLIARIRLQLKQMAHPRPKHLWRWGLIGCLWTKLRIVCGFFDIRLLVGLRDVDGGRQQ